jgi:SAM-dependent methyltransferase
VGCGTGYQLRLLARLAARMRLSLLGSTRRRRWWRWLKRRQRRTAPLLDDAFDLVLSTTSFDHWIDQRAGLRECARVLVADGRLVLVDLFSAFLIPTLVGGRRTRARTKPRANRLLAGEGLHPVGWQHVPLPDQRCRSCQVARNAGDRSAALLLGAERLGHRVRAVTPAIGSVSPESAAHGTRSKRSTTPRTGSVWLEHNG